MVTDKFPNGLIGLNPNGLIGLTGPNPIGLNPIFTTLPKTDTRPPPL